ERASVETAAEFNIILGPSVKFGEIEVGPGELGATISYRKVFPVIQSYGAGESSPYWIFKAHRTRPLAGSQFVYAVVVARDGVQVQAQVELIATAETRFGPLRLGLPDEARASTTFAIP
ncbi:MAG: hypothetical protein GY778_27575, partial [bacterium]|nr:hypothetical protein [bacterium]